jgi:sec-independent protein translocase protein TatA
MNEWMWVAIAVVVLFGGSQLPKLARSIGQAQKEFKKGLSEGAGDDASADKKPSA